MDAISYCSTGPRSLLNPDDCMKTGDAIEINGLTKTELLHALGGWLAKAVR